MQILVQGQFSSLEINWLKSSTASLFFYKYAIFRAWTIFSERRFCLLSLFPKFRENTMLTQSKQFHENFFVIWNFSEFLPCNNTKKGWPCFAWVVFAKSITCWKQPRRRGGWDMIINSLRTLPYGRGLYAKYTNKTHHDLSNTNRGCVRKSLHILQWTSKQSFGTFVNPDPLQAFW